MELRCAQRELAIFGGARSSAAVPTTLYGAVVALHLDVGDSSAICSAAVIAPTRLLTAGHCLHAARQSSKLSVEFHTGGHCQARNAVVSESSIHPDLDVGVLNLLDRDAFGAFIPLYENALNATWLNRAVELAGFGLTEFGTAGGLRLVSETVIGLEESHIVVEGPGDTGACIGDSGGPLLGRDADGQVRVIGILDDGDASCTGKDYYTRSDRIALWLTTMDGH